jgi:hypothetical protein
MSCRPESAAITVPENGMVHWPTMWKPDRPGKLRSMVCFIIFSGVMYQPSGDPCQFPV